MQKIRLGSITKLCLTMLSLTLLNSWAFGLEDNKVSYLDSVSSSYLYNNNSNINSKSILNSNSSEARPIETTLKLDATSAITTSNAVVNLSLRDSDVKQALRMLADKANLNIVFDESVDGKITLDLNNIRINDAFMIIFKSLQLTYFKDGNTITVMKLDRARDLAYTRKSMTVLPVKYVVSGDLASFLNSNLFSSNIFGLSNQPVVTSNARNNELIIFGTPADVAAVKRILPILDTKPMINNFKVNHTTPKEMASLICSTLFNIDGNGGGSNSSDTEVVLGGGYKACEVLNSVDSSKEGLTAFKSGQLSITYYPELGRISTFGGSVEQIEIIRDFIKDNDKKQLMAYVELSVIELNETGSKSFSNTWNLWTPFINLGFTPSSGLSIGRSSPFFVWGDHYLAPTTSSSSSSDGSSSSSSSSSTLVTKTNNKALLYELNYIVENGNGRVLTNPKIMVTNGKKAVIDMTSDYIKSVTSQVLESSNSITSATQKTYDIGSDEGLLIEIVPFISPDGYVSMNISPEFATIKQQVTSYNPETRENEIQATLLQRRDLELKNIRIRDGETLVLAGLIKENETQTVRKMPFLSDLPFIGVFFRGNDSTKSREELVIVVTPHIVRDGQDSFDNKIYDL